MGPNWHWCLGMRNLTAAEPKHTFDPNCNAYLCTSTTTGQLRTSLLLRQPFPVCKCLQGRRGGRRVSSPAGETLMRCFGLSRVLCSVPGGPPKPQLMELCLCCSLQKSFTILHVPARCEDAQRNNAIDIRGSGGGGACARVSYLFVLCFFVLGST